MKGRIEHQRRDEQRQDQLRRDLNIPGGQEAESQPDQHQANGIRDP